MYRDKGQGRKGGVATLISPSERTGDQPRHVLNLRKRGIGEGRIALEDTRAR
jgi:hypothetical protein